MLSIGKVSPKQGADYFKEDNYYSKEEALEQSKWFGEGAARLGLEGRVDSNVFQNLLNGKSPDGRRLLRGKKVNPKKHRAAIDLTFSAPKSVSIAILMGGDKQLEQAHRIAVERTLKIIEQLYSQARVWDGKQQQKINTGNLVVAQHHHTTSREKDPNIHTHCVLINATQLPNGKWRALTNEELYNQKMLLGAIYRNELAYLARKLGYEIEIREDELFEIKGYTQFQLDWFSKRRQQILELVGPDATAAAKEWATLQTRAGKGKELPREELLGWWLAQNEAFNLQIKHPVPQRAAQVEDTTAAAATALKEAIEHCSERTVAFKRKALEKFIFNEIKQFSYAELEEALVNDPELLATFDRRFTTQAAVTRELETIRLMQQGQGQVESIATTDAVNDYLENKTLTSGQKSAIALAATTTDQFIAWQGVALAEKTYALNEFREIATTQGYVLSGYAPSSVAAKVLGEEVGIESTTVASLIETKQPEEIQPNSIWIVDEAGLLSAKDAHALLQRATEQQARVILVGDTRQLSAVEVGNPFKSLQTAGMQSAHLNQSQRQRSLDLQQAVDLIAAGQVQQGIKKLRVHNRIAVIPDNEQRLKQLVAEYMAATLKSRENTLVLAGTTNASRLQIIQLIRAELKLLKELGKTANLTVLKPKDLTQVQARYTHHYTVGDVVIPTREYKRLGLTKFQPYAVTEIDRNQLSLRSVDGDVTLVDPMVFRKTVYTQQQIEIAVGEKLKWTHNNKQFGQRNGQEFKVTTIDDNYAQIQYKNGLTDSINLNQLNHLDYALVSTTGSSQGKTVDRVLIAADRTLGKESFYVATSRAKYDLKIYADDEATLLLLAQKSKAKENPLEVIKPQRTELAVSATTINASATSVSPPTIDEEITHGRTNEPTASTEKLKSGDGEGVGRRTVSRLESHSRTARPNRRLGERPTASKSGAVKPSSRTNQPTTSQPRPRLTTSSERTRRGGRCYDKISPQTPSVGTRPQPTTNTLNRIVKSDNSQSNTAATVSSSKREIRQHHTGLQRLGGNSHTLVKRMESSSGTNAVLDTTGAVTPESMFRAGQSSRQSNAQSQRISGRSLVQLSYLESAAREITAMGAVTLPDASQPEQSDRQHRTKDRQLTAGVEPISNDPNALVEDLAASNRAVDAWGTTTEPEVGVLSQPLRQPTERPEQFDAGLRQLSDRINVQLRDLESTGRSAPAAIRLVPTNSGATEPTIQQLGAANSESVARVEQVDELINSLVYSLESNGRADESSRPTPGAAVRDTNLSAGHSRARDEQSAKEFRQHGEYLNTLAESFESTSGEITLPGATIQSADVADGEPHQQPGAANGQPTTGLDSHLQQLGRVSSQLGGIGASLADITSQTQQHSLTEIATRLGLEPQPNNSSRWQKAGVVVDIEGDRFYNHSSRQGGGSITFIMQMRHCSYLQAISWLKQGAPAVKRTEPTSRANQSQPVGPYFTPPVADLEQWSKVRHYLVEQRHLPAYLVDELHEAGKVYADNSGNAVFLQVANQGRVTRANLLDTNSARSVTQLAPGSLSGDGWFQLSQGSGRLTKIVLTDSPVNAMSLAALEQGQQQDRTVFISIDSDQNSPSLSDFAAQGVRVEVAFETDTIGERKARQVMNSVAGAVRRKPSQGKNWNEELLRVRFRQATATYLKPAKAIQKQPLLLQQRMLQAIQHDCTQYKCESQADMKLVVQGLVAGHSFQQIKDDIDKYSALVQHWKKSDDYATAVNKTIKYTQQLCEEAPTLPVYYQQLYQKYVSDIQKELGYLQPTQIDREVALAALKSYPEDTVQSILKCSLTAHLQGGEYVQQTLKQAQHLALEVKAQEQKQQQPHYQKFKDFELGD